MVVARVDRCGIIFHIDDSTWVFTHTIVVVVVVGGMVVDMLVLCFEIAHSTQCMLVVLMLERAIGC